MKKFLRWAILLLVLLLALIGLLLLGKDSMLRSFAESRVRQKTGLETHIGELKVPLGTATIAVRQCALSAGAWGAPRSDRLMTYNTDITMRMVSACRSSRPAYMGRRSRRSAMSSASTTAILTCRLSRNSSATRRIPPSAPFSKAASD